MTCQTMLRLYVDLAWRRTGVHTMLLIPWWGNPYASTSVFSKQMFDAYQPDTTAYTITDDIRSADMVLLPYPHAWFLKNDYSLFISCVARAEKAGLPILIDGMEDIERPIPVRNAYILRYGGYRFLPDKRVVVVPLAVDDLLERCKEGRTTIRKKRAGKPVVGFAGWAQLSTEQQIRALLKELPVRLRGIFDGRYQACRKGIFWRQCALAHLRNSPLVETNFRVRRSFSANQKTVEGGNMEKVRMEMVETILESDYALDVRGDANNSARLFEILSLGRIPVIIDTERNLSFSNKVDYASFALTIDFRDIGKLSQRIAEFHENISPFHFEEMQKNARQAFIHYFRIDAIMRHVVEEIRLKISRKYA